MTVRIMVCIVICLYLNFALKASAQSVNPDIVTQQLFSDYVVKQGKVETETVNAAMQLIAARGRSTGFWKVVLTELQSGNTSSELGCVRILGKMLATDASARDAIRRRDEQGEVSAWIPNICLEPEVVTVLIERGQKADRFQADHYVIALMRSRLPEAKEVFEEVLNLRKVRDSSQERYYLESTRYHAAVGLAQLGDRRGIEWLIAYSKDIQGTVSNAWPKGVAGGGSMASCCIGALQQLSGQRSLTDKSDWQSWLKTLDPETLLSHSVEFGDPQ